MAALAQEDLIAVSVRRVGEIYALRKRIVYSLLQISYKISEDASNYDKGWCMAKYGGKCLLLNCATNVVYLENFEN